MKILVVHEISYFDGPVFEFQEFTESFIEAGHDVLVLDFKERQKKGIKKATDESHGRIYSKSVKVISPRLFIANDLLRPLAVFAHAVELLRAFRNFRPDIVFSYSVPTSGPTVALMGRFFKVPVVHRAIDISHKLRPGIFTLAVRLAEYLTFRWSDYVSTHNSALAKYIVSHGGKESKVHIHYPPVQMQKQFGTESKRTKSINVLFVGTLFSSCGLADVISSASSLEYSEIDWRLRIVGDGPLRKSLTEQAERLDLLDKIEFTGWIDFDSLHHHLAWATVGLVPFEKNLLTDCAFPQKTLQYLAAGVPVVSTSLSGSMSELSENSILRFVGSPSDVFVAALEQNFGVSSSKSSMQMGKFERANATADLLDFMVSKTHRAKHSRA